MPVQPGLNSTFVRRLVRSAALAALAAGVGFGAAQASTRIGWVWADQPNAVSSYTPNTFYSYNSAGGSVVVIPQATGVYEVAFAGLGSAAVSNVLVTAYATSGYCGIDGWGGGSGNPVNVTIRCYDASGTPANNYFTMLYQAHSGNIGGATKGLGFLWANQPSTASYTPDPAFQYNSTGATNTVVRNGTGDYTATIPGLDKVGGHVQVSAYGPTAARCKVGSWSQDSGGTHVNVLCFDSAGAPSDQKYTLEYSRHLPTAFLTTATTSGFYAWASKPAVASYLTSGPYSYNAFGSGRPTAQNDSQGNYTVSVPSTPGYSTSDVMVTAYGSSNRYCNVTDWYPIDVACYNQGGSPANSQFDVSFQTH